MNQQTNSSQVPPRVRGELERCVPTFTEIVKYRRESPSPKTLRAGYDLIGRHGPIAPILKEQANRIRNGKPLKVLDIGAYDRALGRSLAKCNMVTSYHSVDIDGSHSHEFDDIRKVSDKYDLICIFELIEHLELQEVCELFHRAFSSLLPGGKLFVSTPNPLHPGRFWGDMTHKQHWPAADLFAVLRHAGFRRDDIEIYGVIFGGAFSISAIPSTCKNWLRYLVWRAIGLEARGGIFVVATNTEL